MVIPAVLPADGLEWRRFRALHLKRQGWSRQDIAEALGVSPVSVSRWFARVRDGGPEALRAHPSPGRPPKLSAAQIRLIPDFLWHGAEAYGFRGEVWTCDRAAEVIREEFGVSYSKSQVSRLLKRLGWTPQVPITRAIQRDEEAIERWRVESWPKNQDHRQSRWYEEGPLKGPKFDGATEAQSRIGPVYHGLFLAYGSTSEAASIRSYTVSNTRRER